MACSKHNGKRYIGLLRCSTRSQTDTSIDDQRRVLEAFALEHGMVAVDFISLEGVSGSQPGNRTDIQDLVSRKLERDDFDTLLVQDSSRFTRSGTQHAHKIESDLNAAGIEVLFAADSIPDGDIGDLAKSFYAFSNKHQAKSIAYGSARGSMSSILDGRSPYARRPPYGIDRLYIAPGGQPSHIIRNLADGRQLKLHPTTFDVLSEFSVNERSGIPNHYIKQKQERIELVLGDPDRVEVVQRIYHRHYVDGLGYYRITSELNQEGIPSPTGKKWNTTTIGQILKNTVYTGTGIANRYTAAVYNMRAPDRPIESNVSKQELYSRKRPATKTRPREDWHVQEQPQLAEFLDEAVRQTVIKRQTQVLDNQASGHSPKPNRDRHLDSSFFLKGILRSKQGDVAMTGVTTGNRGSKKRYYRISRAFSAPDGDRVMRRLVPAEPLELAVLETVRQTLLNLPELRNRIEAQVRAEMAATSQDNQQLGVLLAERDAIGSKLKLVLSQFNSEMEDLVRGEIDSLKGKLRSVNDRIARCQSTKPTKTENIDEIVDLTLAAICNLAETMKDPPPATLRKLLSILIPRLAVDLETRDAELEITLPIGLNVDQIRMCLVEGFAYKSFNQTHSIRAQSLAPLRLIWQASPVRGYHLVSAA
jgi:hypothetical protein